MRNNEVDINKYITSNNIISSLIMSAENEVINELPSLNSCNYHIINKRNQTAGVFDSIYEDQADVFKHTIKGEVVLFYDSGYESRHRTIIFLLSYSKLVS
ncbi:hypothetical protein ENBRE01_2552 [Enteropsectra breve]|nr:hypothetical protein ENBRE01_2552 [Enteropsectra breve]